MVNYRRDKTKGATYFFTLTLSNRQSNLLTQYIDSLRFSFKQAQYNNPFDINAIVVLPEHLHMIIELPEMDDAYMTRIRQIKTYFTRDIIKQGESLIKNQRNEYQVWQTRFWEHRIRDDEDYFTHFNYIHYNPVKHGLVQKVIDWPYSSFHHYVHKKTLPFNWGMEETIQNLGE